MAAIVDRFLTSMLLRRRPSIPGPSTPGFICPLSSRWRARMNEARSSWWYWPLALRGRWSRSTFSRKSAFDARRVVWLSDIVCVVAVVVVVVVVVGRSAPVVVGGAEL